MSIRYIFDDPRSHYTNLDVVKGKVVLSVSSPMSINFITVKLEGESRTRLLAPPRPGYNERPRPLLEIHKLLYRVITVFPPTQELQHTGSSRVFAAGQYAYPFEFKIPFNNNCNAVNVLNPTKPFGGLPLEMARPPARHVRTTLPPSIYFPGEAEIRYYVKATVNRPGLFKENLRALHNINLVPIEPPREVTAGEAYARVQHQFLHGEPPKNSGITSLFKGKESIPPSPSTSLPPARISVDIRLPNPPVLTCGQDIPLRVLIKQLSERSEELYLQTLQIELIATTRVQAHEAVRDEKGSWVIISLTNLKQPIGSKTDAIDTETALTKELWYGHKLPNTVSPTFITCNIQRSYELVVSVGLSYGSLKSTYDQFTVKTLRLAVKVFSGIRPPDALLKRMETGPERPILSGPSVPAGAGAVPPAYQSPAPGPSNAGPAPQNAPPYEEAPPSYEDAIALDLPPVSGPRPEYRPPPAPEGGDSRLADEKR
ncbi:hypothetical protein EJ06DRAFT_528962 [Trichodelitschia bisporula]|uniref:Arrestin-like N-terminal domain-containing protein n=1 Tax=Trichodelitschia bisporula TaxID=703511 RepID=A0A6G1I157_9PEZI|nr:hypothetical protein EJ06DRAFT_528962 [Trichodelitschia bisporula]